MLLKVENIGKKVSNQDLFNLFSSFGDCDILLRRGNSVYIEYENDQDAYRAIKNVKGRHLNGRKLKVSKSIVPSWVLKESKPSLLSSWNQIISLQ